MLLHLEKRVFADVIKNLETRSSCINHMGPKCHHKCPYERGIEEDERSISWEILTIEVS